MKLNFTCPNCRTAFQVQMPHSQPVLDIVCQWNNAIMTVTEGNAASIVNDDLILSLTFGKERRLLTLRLGENIPLPGQPGKTATVRLDTIAPGVRKLRPSLLTDDIHAFITIVDCPETKP